MKNNYDVIVVGAGPAGLAAAITAAKQGLRTLLLEKSTEIGFPVKTSAITWREVIDKWNLPESVMYQWYDSFYINSLNSKKEVEITFDSKQLGTLDYHIFLRELAFQAASAGVDIKLGQRVQQPLLDGDRLTGVTTKNNKYYSQIVLDCSGSQAILAKQLDLLPKRNDIEIGIGVEYEMTNVSIRNPDALEFYVGEPEIVPIGYGWLFPVSKTRAKVGICTVYNTPEVLEEKNIQTWFDRFLSEQSPIYTYIRQAQPYEVHLGSYPLSGMLEKPYANGLLVVGDAAAQASMLLGEGIRYAMEFGKRAALVAHRAVTKNDVSEDVLRRYPASCYDYLGETYDVALDLLQIPTNEYWNTLVDSIIQLKKDERSDLVLQYLKTAMNYQDAQHLFPGLIPPHTGEETQ